MVWEATDIREVDVAAPGEAGAGPPPNAELSPATLEAIEALFERYPTRRAVLLPALHLAQEQIGFLPPGTLVQLAELVGIAPAEVLDVVSFYEMYWTRPKGRRLVQLCRSISCELCGCTGLLDAVKSRLGIGEGETTEDGEFTLMTVECLAACDKAPVVLVNETLYENVTAGNLDEILGAEERTNTKDHEA